MTKTQAPEIIRIGTDGWLATGSRMISAPSGTATLRALSEYAAQFDVVDVTQSFHALPTAETMSSWRQAVPEQFRFVLTVPRAITHERRLRACESAVARVWARSRNLEGRLDSLLFNLPSSGIADPGRLEALLTSRDSTARWLFDTHGTPWDQPAVHNLITSSGAFVRTRQPPQGVALRARRSGEVHALIEGADGPGKVRELSSWARRAHDAHAMGHRVTLVCGRPTVADDFNTARRLRQLLNELDDHAEREQTTSAVL